jgi:hypothetical protein
MSYQTTIDKARGFEQLSIAMRQGSVPTPPSQPPENEAYLAVIRAKAANAVYSVWNESRKPAQLGEIFIRVRSNIANDETWPKDWTWPSKRTVDRRVNEAADFRFYHGPTPIVAVKAGVYCPNPARFDGLAKTVLESLIY